MTFKERQTGNDVYVLSSFTGDVTYASLLKVAVRPSGDQHSLLSSLETELSRF